MANVNQELFDKVQNKTGLSRAALYARIKKLANAEFITNDVALLKIAAQLSIGIQRFAKPEQLAAMQGKASMPAPMETVSPRASASRRVGGTKSKPKKRAESKAASNSVFVVHGRDMRVRAAMFTFLRAIGLHPIEFDEAIKLTGKAAPHISEILDAAFAHAKAVVVLLTPDDEAQMRPQFHSASTDSWEKALRGQARPNVIFEAGIAMARNQDSTVLVQIGDMRPFSDVAGRHVVHLSNSTQSRQQLITKLTNAGCLPNLAGVDWHDAGDFTLTPPPAPLKLNGRKIEARPKRKPVG